MKKVKTIFIFAIVFLLVPACESDKFAHSIDSSQYEEAENEEESSNSQDESDLDGIDDNDEVLDSLNSISDKKSEIISRYQKIFDLSGVPYEVLPNGDTLIGTETSYKILDVDYSVGELISAIYYPSDDVVKVGVNLTFDYHPEKGLDKENKHVKLLYNILSELEAYTSIDEMISDMTDSTEYSNGMYAWETSAFSDTQTMKFSCYEQINCDFSNDLQFVQFDDLDIRNSKMEEYVNLVNKRLKENGFSDNRIVRTQIKDGWENDTYARKIDNDLGIVVRFNEINTLSDNILEAVNIVKIYVDCSNEVFGIQTPYSSELLAQDIVSRARLLSYNDDNGVFRICQESEYQKVNLPCNELLEQYINPVDAIQYKQSGYFIDSLGWYSDKEGSMIIEYYIPIQVDGLQNKY